MLSDILENKLIDRLAAGLPRSPQQVNRIHESDAELLTLACRRGSRLAVTTDTIAEEIASGLYADPWLIGWMTVMVNMSDLAAVGATPLGMLIAETLPRNATGEFLGRLQQGIAEACTSCGTYVLGGDTNSGQSLSMTGTAIGVVESQTSLTRLGCSPGEALFVSGPVGQGSAYAFARLTGSIPPQYRPLARIREGKMLHRWATCCMDTSDGLIASLDQLMRLNNVGFALASDWESALTPDALALSQRLKSPSWISIAGEHGEFELVFTVPDERVEEFLLQTQLMNWHPFRIGTVVDSCGFFLPSENGKYRLKTAEIRNLARTAGSDPEGYVAHLCQAVAMTHRATDS
jgi:thiamine-monophosphate kinase